MLSFFRDVSNASRFPELNFRCHESCKQAIFYSIIAQEFGNRKVADLVLCHAKTVFT